MRRTRLSIALALTVLVGGACLAGAAEPAPETGAPPPPQASPQRTLLPEELQQVLTPEPENKIPVLYFAGRHPCSVSIPCDYGSVSCSTTGMGQSCYYQWDFSPTYPGYVKCGSTTVTCSP